MNGSFFLPDPEERGEALPITNIHAMVDLETLATHVRAPILTIGAVLFDPLELDTADALWERSFLVRIAVQSSLKYLPELDPDTLGWWLAQDDSVIKELIGNDAMSLKDGLIRFRQYCMERIPKTDDWFFPGHSQYPLACRVWAKGPDFDCRILENAYAAVGEINPWSFYEYRCVRTVQDLAWPEGPDSRPHFDCGKIHDARADAVNQAMAVQAAHKILGLSNSSVKLDTW